MPISNWITVARNEWKYVADLEAHFDPALPLIKCPEGEFNQRILNPIFNAAHAIARSVVVDKHGGTIHFETETGKGTTFILRHPRDRETLTPKAVAA